MGKSLVSCFFLRHSVDIFRQGKNDLSPHQFPLFLSPALYSFSIYLPLFSSFHPLLFFPFPSYLLPFLPFLSHSPPLPFYLLPFFSPALPCRPLQSFPISLSFFLHPPSLPFSSRLFPFSSLGWDKNTACCLYCSVSAMLGYFSNYLHSVYQCELRSDMLLIKILQIPFKLFWPTKLRQLH